MAVIGLWIDNINAKRVDNFAKDKYLKVIDDIFRNIENKNYIDSLILKNNLEKVENLDKNNDENAPEAVPAENQPESTEAAPEETPKPKEESTEAKTKAYIRVATYNKKTDADEALKKLDGDFKIRNSKTSSGKEVYIIISKTVSSNEDLEKLKEKVKNYSYQIINQK